MRLIAHAPLPLFPLALIVLGSCGGSTQDSPEGPPLDGQATDALAAQAAWAKPLPRRPGIQISGARVSGGDMMWVDLDGDGRRAASLSESGLAIKVEAAPGGAGPFELRFQVATIPQSQSKVSGAAKKKRRRASAPKETGTSESSLGADLPRLRIERLGSSVDGVAPLDAETSASWTTVSIPLEAEGASEFKLGLDGDPMPGHSTWISEPWIAGPWLAGPEPETELAGKAQPRTVVLITSDTHRADHVSAINPDSPVTTPHLDALAGEGAVFTNCFTAINNTNPSHIALMTGLHPRDFKIINNNTRLSEDADTLAERFRAAGYQCYAALSAFHLYDEMSGLGQGFHRMNATFRSQRSGESTLDVASEWLQDAGDAPVFIWIHLFDVHSPYRLHPEQKDALLAGRPDPYRMESDLGFGDHQVPDWIERAGIRDRAFVNELYAGEVKFLDGHLGPFLQSHRVKDSLVAFTADHGEGLGEQSTFWAHFGVLTSTIHVPLILRGPGVTPGQRIDSPARMIDVGKTVLRMANVDDSDFPGKDARELLAGPRPLEPRYALAAHGICASVESDGWLLQLFLKTGNNRSSGRIHAFGSVSLFRLEDDPRCEDNVLLDHFRRAQRMRTALIDWLAGAVATGLNGANQITPAQEAKLAELGYSGGAEAAMRWWAPEFSDLEWATNPWNLAFQGDGRPALLEGLLSPTFEGAR